MCPPVSAEKPVQARRVQRAGPTCVLCACCWQASGHGRGSGQARCAGAKIRPTQQSGQISNNAPQCAPLGREDMGNICEQYVCIQLRRRFGTRKRKNAPGFPRVWNIRKYTDTNIFQCSRARQHPRKAQTVECSANEGPREARRANKQKYADATQPISSSSRRRHYRAGRAERERRV